MPQMAEQSMSRGHQPLEGPCACREALRRKRRCSLDRNERLTSGRQPRNRELMTADQRLCMQLQYKRVHCDWSDALGHQ